MTVSTTSFDEIRSAGDDLRRLLSSHGVRLSPGSVLAQALESVDEAIAYFKAQVCPTAERGEQLVDDLVAIEALGRVAKTIRGLRGMPKGLLERLQGMGGGDPRVTSAGDRSAERDAMFELLCWHVCMQFANEVEFAEPDITCRYREHLFGLACKAHYGQSDRAVQAIRRGWNQILSSPVDYGFVMLHLTNHLHPGNMTYPLPDGRVLVPADEASLFARFGENLVAASRPIRERFVSHLKRHPKADEGRFHGTLYVAHSIATLQGTSTRVGGMIDQGMDPNRPEAVRFFLKNINAFWQDLSCARTAPV